MNFPEFKYTELYIDGIPEGPRNKIVEVNEIHTVSARGNLSECYRSLFRFDQGIQEHIAKNTRRGKPYQSVAGYSGACYTDHLIWDIDRANDLPAALIATQTIIGRLQHSYQVPEAGIRTFFTGSKGFNISIPFNIFGTIPPSSDIPEICKQLAHEIAGEIEIDDDLYQTLRLYRICDTINKKSGLFKIELTPHETMTWDIARIKDLAKQARHLQREDYDHMCAERELAKLIKPITPKDKSKPKKSKADHWITDALQGVSEGHRENTLLQLVGYYDKKRIPHDVLEMQMADWNEKNKPPLADDEFRRTLESFYSRYAKAEPEKEWNEGISAADLVKLDIPEPEWLVPDYLPQGFTILAGKPKVGKSWLALGLAIAIGCGGKFLSNIDVINNQGDVLYLALEDNLRRLKSRLGMTLRGADAPQCIQFHTEFPRANKGGIDRIKNWVESHDNPKLVVIDTLQKFRDIGREGGNIYAEDYSAVEGLKRIADDRNICIMVLHHLRKMGSTDDLDTVSGSLGLTGGADTTLILTKERLRADGVLKFFGRDVEEKEMALRFDNTLCNWVILGEADDYRATMDQQAIINVLRESDKPLGPKEVMEMLGKKGNTVYVLMSRMAKKGTISVVKRGQYTVKNI